MPHFLRGRLHLLTLIALAFPLWANAESAKPDTPVVGTSAHLLNMTLGLLLIVGLILGLAWLLRRFGQSSMFSHQKAIKIVAAMALGTRERLVVVDVGGQQILLGVTAREINTLHVFEEPVIDPGQAAPPSDFSRKLMAVLQKKDGGDR
ncbi:flagellar biosynthetic protein FliO [Marinimicrobium sp. ABcell2]|uniref:flagellar biosynthetic protein FliO n=1 Tax=Marinimicrobium sp. ABcell2 TaxID=3069751 RepID=UPI0027B38457|nr:flagellar biosynthetic protein FliO [Marinimicrobium sp. ABcell2]MDQ2078085.1 flagellar biosynthetic protein FliO [Marinimicrobium sp. ABcell2]